MKNFNDFNMSEASDVMNFNRQVIIYLNDNYNFVVETAKALNVGSIDELVSEFIEHLNINRDAYDEEKLSDEAKQQFRFVATQALRDGFFAHAGSVVEDNYLVSLKINEINSFLINSWYNILLTAKGTRGVRLSPAVQIS